MNYGEHFIYSFHADHVNILINNTIFKWMMDVLYYVIWWRIGKVNIDGHVHDVLAKTIVFLWMLLCSIFWK